MSRIRAATALGVALLGLLPCMGCGWPRVDPPPNVILVTIDTLRWDHVSSYGYARTTTPFIDGLAATGVRFHRTYSTSSWTAPAVASLITSLHPGSHGVVDGTVTQGAVCRQQILSEHLTRLPEILGQAGYTTFGITANGHLTRELGFAQGFDHYENLDFGATADEVNRKLELWRDRIESSIPYFVWLHYFDPHTPYLPREPWLAEYATVKTLRPPSSLTTTRAELYQELGLRKGDRDFNYVVALYDGEVGYTDQAVEWAVRLLDPGSEDLVLVTADHGEEFLDHGVFGHDRSLYQELIRVPLIVRYPDRQFAGRTVEDPVSLVDIGPSLLDFLGIEVPAHGQGKSFMPLVRGGRRTASRPIVTSLARWRRIESIILDDWKYIRYLDPGSAEMLFHLETDPTEQRDLAHSGSLKRAKLAMRLEQELLRYSAATEPEVRTATQAELDRLRSLGYLDQPPLN